MTCLGCGAVSVKVPATLFFQITFAYKKKKTQWPACSYCIQRSMEDATRHGPVTVTRAVPIQKKKRSL